MKRLLFLASGRGSNFQAIVEAIHSGRLTHAQAVGVLCNKAGAPVLDTAKRLRVPATLVDQTAFRGPSGKWDRQAYETALLHRIEEHRPDWIILAGYLLLLSPALVRKWGGKIVNIHPPLLPAFPGLHAQKQALESGAKRTGCTVHLVTEGLDEGPVIEQAECPILPSDTVESLSARLLPLEHATYIRAIQSLCTRRFDVADNRVRWL